MSPKSKPAPRRKATPATAAGQALGYGLQYTRLTAILLDASPGSRCSLEVLDDVAEELASGETKLGQSKSALTGNPVADRAVALWKSLFNWLSLIREGYVSAASTTFELYVSRPVGGALIEAFHAATTAEAVEVAVQKAREELLSEGAEELPDGLRKYVIPVLEADEKVLTALIANLQLKCGSGSPQADIEAAIRRGPVSDSRVFDIANQMCGWVKREVDKQLERGVPAVILQEAFHKEYVAYVRRVDREIILKSLAGRPSDAEKKERLFDTFVRQLDLIQFSFEDKLAAISDFLRACSDRAKWSEAGDVHEESFVELDENLVRTWGNQQRAIAVEAATKPDVERGQLLHARCMDHQAKVQGMDPPSHFVPGCFHGLADEMAIGWHPSHRELLAAPVAEAS
jgi:hypothetical protein